jgi:ERF superfamily
MSNETVNPETGEITVPTADPVAEEPVGARENGCNLWLALAKAQGAIEQPSKTETADVKNPQGVILYSYKYAPLDAYLECIKKPFADNGLYLNQRIIQRDGRAFVCTTIFNSDGQHIEGDYPILVSGQSAQNFAGGVTYARRYGLMLAVGLFAEKDDDANAASGNIASITERAPATQQNRRPATTPVQQPDPNRRAATDARNRLRDGIDNAETLDQLPALTKEDETLIRSVVSGNDRIGDRIWQSLIDLDAEKRLALAQAGADKMDEDPFDSFIRPEDTGNALGR